MLHHDYVKKYIIVFNILRVLYVSTYKKLITLESFLKTFDNRVSLILFYRIVLTGAAKNI